MDAQGAVGSCAPACAGGGPSQSSPGGESHGATHSGRATVAAPQGEVLPGTARSGISLMNLKIGDSETPKSRITRKPYRCPILEGTVLVGSASRFAIRVWR